MNDEGSLRLFREAGLSRRLGIDGALLDVRTLGRGHIHQTFLATYRTPEGPVARYIHQRLNSSVFPNVDVLMANLIRVTEHLATRVGDPRRAVRVRPTAEGAPYARDSAGAAWRTLDFVDGTRTEPRFHGPAQAAAGAVTASRLVAHLSDLDGPPLTEIIPGFHHVVSRLDQLRRARQADLAGRAVGCKAEADAVFDNAGVAREVAEARTDGRLPERTVHNDAKIDNLLFDEATGAGLCMVDLDTVGPGTVLFDVGDLVRSGAAVLPEDGDPYAATVDQGIVAAILKGYARAGADFLTPAEVDLFPLAGPLMALEAAARFLTDHLQGDVYFRVNGPDHNLLRARNQLRILELLLAA